ncbi:MAG TPA: diacylglycerol kinase family protein [Anaerolineae bacterium]|nr:diacylglycerol kinase family protein [Anaerolineae bacterium]
MGEIAAVWEKLGWEVTVVATQRAGHATEIAAAAAGEGVLLVLAAGGDGTLGEVATGLAHSETIMGALPSGTANTFAAELGLPRPSALSGAGLMAANELLTRGRIQRMDLGQCEGDGRYWLLWAGIGADSYVVNKIEPRPKWVRRTGRLGYMLLAARWLAVYRGGEATIEVDEQVLSGHFYLATVCNSRLYGGSLPLNMGGQLDDGVFEVLLFEANSFGQALRLLWLVVRGRHVGAVGVKRLEGKRVVMRTAGGPWAYHTDGDPHGETPLEVRVEPRALRLLVGEKTDAHLFQEQGLPLSEFIRQKL